MAEKLKTTAFDEPANIGVQNIATAYAKALFNAGEKAGVLDKLVVELEELVDAIGRHQKVVDVLASSMFSPDHKAAMIDRAFAGKVQPLLLNFLKVLAEHDRSYILRSVREEFRRLYDKKRGLVQVKIVTAAPLSAAQESAVGARMKSILGGEPILRTEVDPSLIGGLVAQVGDVVFDGSLASNLARLREQLINRSVHEIQRRRDRVRPAS
jgi:F-type H+-transporting ATPase subunit delta